MESPKVNPKLISTIIFIGWIFLITWMFTDLKKDINKLTTEVDELTFWSYLKLGQINKSDTTVTK